MFENEMNLNFVSLSENESFARVAVAAFAAQLNPTLEEINEIKTVVSEAVTNSIIHGYSETIGYIYLNCNITGDRMELVITDHGCGIQDLEQAKQPLYTSRPDLERSGMGFTIMESFVDQFYVESEAGNGTTIRLIKHFKTSKRAIYSEV
jgi:stage II sporulation protein AB (anti-sigma F factor)